MAATRDILNAISAQCGDEKPVFDIILENACRLCNASTAWLTTVDKGGDHVIIPAWRGASESFAAGFRDFREPIASSSLSAVRAMIERKVIRIDDIEDTDLYRQGEPNRVRMVEVEGIKSIATVPLLKGDRGVGSILLYRREVDPFTDDNIALIETFAAQAVVAIENVRQFRELQTRLEREAATRNVLSVISRSRDDEAPVFETIFESVQRLCATPQAVLMLASEDRSKLEFVASRGDGREKLDRLRRENPMPVDADDAFARAFREQASISIDDIQTLASWGPGEADLRTAAEVAGIRSFLIAPLISDGRSIGVLSVYRHEVKPFTSDEIMLLEGFAAQAVIAIENVRQFREVQERLERETATKNILRVISQSRDDEAPVFGAILDSATQLCDAESGSLMLINDQRTHTVLKARSGKQWGFEVEASQWPLDLGHAQTEAARTGEVVHEVDLKDSDIYRSGDETRVMLVDKIGLRTALAVPLLQRDTPIGVIVLHRLEVARAFSENDIKLVESFAAQAVIAIENVRQFRELQERLQREAATKNVLRVISESRDDDGPVFDAILDSAAHLCDAKSASLMLLNEEGTHNEFQRVFGRKLERKDSQLRWALNSGQAHTEAVRTGAVVHVHDLRDTELYRNGDETRVRLVDDVGVSTALSVPILRDQAAIGAIALTRHGAPRPFSDNDIQLVESFAAQAVIAIENVRQFREVQERLEREAATREILSVISHSRDDAIPVFETLLRIAQRLCQASNGALVLGEEGGGPQILAAQTGPSRQTLERYRDGAFTMDPATSLAAKAIIDGETLYYPKIVEGAPYREGMETVRMLVEKEGMQTSLYVPLMLNGKGIGCINIQHKDQRNYGPDEITLIQTFAAQAVIAIENVRQFREVQERLERERASAEILEVISKSRDDEKPVFDTILENTAHLCQTDLATFNLMNDEGTHLEYAADFGRSLHTYKVGVDRWSIDSTLQIAESVREGRIVHNVDLRETQPYIDGDRWRRQLADDEGVRSFLTVPLITAGGKPIGCIGIYRKEVRAFSDDEIALVETFAAQAVIAIENVRQFREVQERLERETATKDILQVISRSRDNDNPVFDAILGSASRICGAERAALLITNEDRTHNEARRAFSAGAPTDLPEQHIWPLDSEHLHSVAVRNAAVVHEPDMLAFPLYVERDPTVVFLVEEAGVRTALAVPLLQGGVAIGAITLHRLNQPRAFSDNDIALVEAFAAQAVIAIENVRQFREVQERLEREKASAEILQVISQSRDDDKPVFDAILRNACVLCNAQQAALILGTAQDSVQALAAQVNVAPAAIELFESDQMLMDGDVSYAARSIIEARLVAFDDMRASDLYAAGSPVVRSMVDDSGIRSVLFAPLIKAGVAIGNITLFRYAVDPFNEFEISLIETFAAQAVIAIENVRQFKALETLNAELGDRVESQVGEIERMGRLKRFLPSAVADAVVTSGDESMLTSHRAMVATLFCDMRGFTAFCEAAEPEETIEVLQTYHQEMSDLIDEYGGGVDQRAGDGIMVIFNDPIPVDDPAGDAVRLAVAMRDKMRQLCAKWKRLGHRLGFGVGISLGYATVGMVGSAGRFDYTASSTSVNTAARLCDMAADGEVLISPRVWVAVEGDFQAESRGEVEMKGIREPVEVFAVS